MKAIVIYEGSGPIYVEDFPQPIANGTDEILVSVKASAIKHLDKLKASGKHYSAQDDLQEAKVPGGDGVGELPDGTKVYALGISGMLAEKAVVDKKMMIKIPEGIDNAVAAALPNAVAGSAMALLFRAKLKKGETVLINGATGFTGNIAVQIARHYGAGKIIVTGRNTESLTSLLALGADETIQITQDTEHFVSQIREIHHTTPIDVILDYLWGTTAELLLGVLKGRGAFTHKTRFVSIGSLAGDNIQLSSEILRSVDLQLTGSGMGSWTKEEIKQLLSDILPEMFQLAIEQRFKVPIETVALKDIQKLWGTEVPGGQRLVVTL